VTKIYKFWMTQKNRATHSSKSSHHRAVHKAG